MTRKITNFALLFVLVTFATALTRAQTSISDEGTAVNNHVTRHQMAAFLVRAFNLNPPPPAMQRFTDVPPSHPNYNFIDQAVKLGIIQSCGYRRFCPAQAVSREQMAAFIIRSLGEFNPPTPAMQRFTDLPPTNPFYAFIDLAASRKLIAGCGGNNFCPKEPVTRAEAAAAIRKAFPSKSNSPGPKGGGQQKSPAEEQIPLESFQVEPRGSDPKRKERQAGLKEMQAEREKENSQAVTGRVTGLAIDPNAPIRPINKMAHPAQPDLTIKQFLFPPTNDKALRVHVVNQGNAASGACRLILTVRKINGVAVGRRTHVNVPALAAGADDWLHIDVKSILPNNVSLQSTTFKLNVDATEIVAESKEGNNEVWHNL